MIQSVTRSLHARRGAIGVVALAAGLFVGVSALAASDYLLEIEGVKGESRDDAHKETIEIASWSWGASNPVTTCQGSAGAGKATISAPALASSPLVVSSAAKRQHWPRATLTMRKAGGSGATSIELENVLITSIAPAARGPRQSTAYEVSFSRASWNTAGCETR